MTILSGRLFKLAKLLRSAGMALAFSAGAATAASDEALLSGSDRLLFATLGRDQPLGGAEIYRATGYRYGLGHAGRPETLLTGIRLSPVFYWDPNVNNGLARDSLVISEMEFFLPSDMVARSGLVYGLEASATQRWSIGQGLTLQPEIGIALSDTREWDKPATAARVSLCAVKTIVSGQWTTMCLQQSHYSGGASRTVNQTDLLLGQDFFLGGAVGGPAHLAGITGRRSVLPEGHRHSVAFRLTSAWTGFGSTEVNLEFGSRLRGVQSRTRHLGVALTKIVLDRPTEFTAYLDRQEGGYFLGDEVIDRGLGIGFARPITDNLKIEVVAERTRSSASAYDSSGVSVRFIMPSLNFYR